MKEICIQKVIISHPKLGDKEFHAHLIIDEALDNVNISLRLYGKGGAEITMIANYLFDSEEKNLIAVPSSSIDDSYIKEITLPSDKVIGIAQGTSYSDKIGSYLLLKLSEVTIKRKYRSSGLKTNDKIHSYYKLSSQVNELFIRDYHYSSHDTGEWKAENRNNKFRKFKKYNYRFRTLFPIAKSFHKGDSSLVLNRQPAIEFKYGKGVQNENTPLLLIKLISFYLKENVDYFHRNYSEGDYEIDNYKHLKYTQFRTKPVRCTHAKYFDIYEFISSVKSKVDSTVLYGKTYNLIDRFVLSSLTKNESKFMILFSIIESVRNELLNERSFSYKENYQFNKQANKELRIALENVAKHCKKSERSGFINSIDGKITNIKRYPMKRQFDTFLNSKYIRVKFSDFDLDLKEIIQLRNRIFHGSQINNAKLFKEINPNLAKVASKMIRLLIKSKDKND